MAESKRNGVMVAGGDVTIETFIDGEGPDFVVLPSYGRDSGADYDACVARMVEGGSRVLRPQPRGIARSTGPMTGVTLHDLADDVALCIRKLCAGPAVVIGHAFGHGVAE